MAQSKQAIKLRQDLHQNIEQLRKDFQEILLKYRINVEAELVNCLELLSSNEDDDLPDAIIDLKQLEFMNQALLSLQYKTDKGRMKDLRKIHYLVKMLATRFSE